MVGAKKYEINKDVVHVEDNNNYLLVQEANVLLWMQGTQIQPKGFFSI